MPRKPTSHALAAEKELRRLVAQAGESPLPTVRELGLKHDVSYATISRILGRLSLEAVVWQHPNGRFYPFAAQTRMAAGSPIVVIGRQIQNWSILYREIIEGISEICTARGCPLVFLSSALLVQHDDPEYPPTLIGAAKQKVEMARLLAAMPRPYGGIILDHLWDDNLVKSVAADFRNLTMLLRPCRNLDTARGTIDLASGIETVLSHLDLQGYRHLIVAYPFSGDPAIEASLAALSAATKAHSFDSFERADCTTPESRRRFVLSLKRRRERVAVISLEDHIATLLWQKFQRSDLKLPARVGLVSLQGTSAAASAVTRLRYDYRSLGRQLVSALLANQASWSPLRPSLVRGRTVFGSG